MFEDESEEDWLTPDYRKQLQTFEEMYASKQYKFMDSDQIEFVLDHLLISNQLKKAKWAAERALEHFPSNSAIIIRYAQTLSQSGKINIALSQLLRLENVEPNNVELFIALATCYSQLKNNVLAIKYFNKALALSSDEEKIDIAIDLAMEYENVKDYQAAITLLNHTLNEGHYNDLLIYELAYCYERIDENQKAIDCLLEYIDVEPYSYTTWYNLGNAYTKTKDLDKAIWAYEYAVLIDDEFIPALYNIANTYMDTNQIEKALEYYIKCLALDDEDPMVFCAIGECYEEIGELELAYEMYSKSADLFPQLADAWIGKGVVSNLLGFHKRAIKEMLVAKSLEPNDAECWRILGNVYEADEQEEKALKSYAKAVKIDAENEDAVLDYFTLMIKVSPDLVFEIIDNSKDISKSKIIPLIRCYCHWVLGNQTSSMMIFEEIIEEDINIAENLFLHFPKMKEVPFFLDRLQEFKEEKK